MVIINAYSIYWVLYQEILLLESAIQNKWYFVHKEKHFGEKALDKLEKAA